MTMLLNTGITSAVSTVPGSILQLRAGPSGPEFPTNMCLQATFTYAGTTGTSAGAMVQTSLDGQTTWTDVAFITFAVTSGRQIANINSSTSITTLYTPTDGTLAAGTIKDGVFGNFWHVKLITTGTYQAGTNIRVDAIGNGITAWTSGD
jgi:hypothetical protein